MMVVAYVVPDVLPRRQLGDSMIWHSRYLICLAMLLLATQCGCRHPSPLSSQPASKIGHSLLVSKSQSRNESDRSNPILPAGFAQETPPPGLEVVPLTLDADPTLDAEPDTDDILLDRALPSPTEPLIPAGPLTLDAVVESIYRSYPLLDSANFSRDIARGKHLAASGNFDLKLKAASENGPVGFYETYRQSLGVVQPLLSGTDVWGGYRIGRGSFQPWYLERQTNDGGEFKAGVSVPLLRNRTIDERRAELWRTGLGRELAEFDIQAQLIGFIQEASYAYWDWVAAGRGYSIATRLVELATSRTEGIRRQVETGLIDPPELTDNLRLVADRRALLADATRNLQQQAAKLSLYLRDSQGQPVVPSAEQLPIFPEPEQINSSQLATDISVAIASRPDLRVMDTLRKQFEIDLRQACNLLQPDVSAVMWGSQDVGAPTSSKRDKSPFELEAGVYVDVPMQRRKARGEITAIEAKIQQLSAKRRMTADKIGVDVQTAYAALLAAFEQVRQAREAVKLAEEMAQIERRNFEAGASDLLKVTLREQYAAESAVKEVDALLKYHQATADYRAAMARDVVTDSDAVILPDGGGSE